MAFLRKAKIAAFKARLQLAEAERKRIVETVTKSQVNMSRLADRIDKVEYEIHALSNELRLLEMPDPDE